MSSSRSSRSRARPAGGPGGQGRGRADQGGMEGVFCRPLAVRRRPAVGARGPVSRGAAPAADPHVHLPGRHGAGPVPGERHHGQGGPGPGARAVGYEINPDFLEARPQKIGGRDRSPFYSEIQLIKTNKRIEELPEIDYTPAIRDAAVLPQAPFIPAKTATLHKVTEIIDEQTIGLDNGHRVKFLGVRVDRRVEALEYLRNRILGKQVLLKENGSNDQETISAYVYLKNKIFINAYLIKSGMASPDLAVNHKLNKKFIKLQEQRGRLKQQKLKRVNNSLSPCKTGFPVILNKVKDLNLLKIRDSSLHSE